MSSASVPCTHSTTMWFVVIALLACALTTFYLFVKQCHNYWSKMGIPCPSPTFFFGNMKDVALAQKHIGVIVTEAYRSFAKYKYIGFYKFLERSVIIRDPQLIGDVLLKDFYHFGDNELVIDENVDFIMSRNIFAMKGAQWKAMRTLLTPVFSSGKIKYVFPLVVEVSQRLIKYLNKEIDAGRGMCFNGKDLCLKFTIDNVASCAFGLNGEAFEGESKFSMVVRDFNDLSYWNSAKLLLVLMFPSLNKYLKVRIFKDDIEEYLTEVVSETLRYRTDNNILRNDFLDHINALKEKSTEFPFTDRDVVAQSAGFFIDGVETSSIIMSQVLYRLGKHPDVQAKVRAEIAQTKASNSNTFTYECINDMKYLDCVIHETLRINGPVPILLKVCTKTYTLPAISDTDGTKLTVNPGDSIIIPLDGIHLDPEYYPAPLLFKPERFFDENKSEMRKNTYFPFGHGPRHCIGMRFGLLQIKVAVVALISNFEVKVNAKMLPHDIHPTALLKTSKRGFWFDFTQLKK